MIIRPAEPKDLPALSQLAQKTYADAFGFSLLPDDLTAHLQNNLSSARFEQILVNNTILVAEAEGKMVGFVQFGHAAGYADEPTPKDGALDKLYVLADYQNQGIGRQLMDAALAQMDSQGMESVYLDVWEHNPGAIKFYKWYGFEIISERHFAVESGVETSKDLIMVRRKIN